MKMDVEVQRLVGIEAPPDGLALGQSAAQLKEFARLNGGRLFIVSASISGNVEQFGLSKTGSSGDRRHSKQASNGSDG